MSQDGLEDLAAELRAPPPDGLAQQLSEDELRNLAGFVREARHRQAAELATAADQALSHIPKLLRVPLRKMLG